MNGEPDGVPGADVLVEWWGSAAPLFGYGPDIPAPEDGEKPSPISSDLNIDMFLFTDDLAKALEDAHKSVTDPTNTNIFPTTPVPDPNDPAAPGPYDPTQRDAGSDSDGGGGGYGGGGVIDDEDVSNQAD